MNLGLISIIGASTVLMDDMDFKMNIAQERNLFTGMVVLDSIVDSFTLQNSYFEGNNLRENSIISTKSKLKNFTVKDS